MVVALKNRLHSDAVIIASTARRRRRRVEAELVFSCFFASPACPVLARRLGMLRAGGHDERQRGPVDRPLELVSASGQIGFEHRWHAAAGCRTAPARESERRTAAAPTVAQTATEQTWRARARARVRPPGVVALAHRLDGGRDAARSRNSTASAACSSSSTASAATPPSCSTAGSRSPAASSSARSRQTPPSRSSAPPTSPARRTPRRCSRACSSTRGRACCGSRTAAASRRSPARASRATPAGAA